MPQIPTAYRIPLSMSSSLALHYITFGIWISISFRLSPVPFPTSFPPGESEKRRGNDVLFLSGTEKRRKWDHVGRSCTWFNDLLLLLILPEGFLMSSSSSKLPVPALLSHRAELWTLWIKWQMFHVFSSSQQVFQLQHSSQCTGLAQLKKLANSAGIEENAVIHKYKSMNECE